MPRPWEFHSPTAVHFGSGGLRKLGQIAAGWGDSALLVGYRNAPGMEAIYARAISALEKATVRVIPFLEIEGEPGCQQADAAVRLARDSKAAAIIGLGGGSAIDTAKAAALAAVTGGCLADLISAPETAVANVQPLPVVAVPTTAGTGSEVSDVAVLTHALSDGQAGLPLKVSLYGPALRPTVALIDPELAVGSPAELTAACGADALGHALEASMSRRAHPLGLTLAAQAVGLIVEHLPRAVANPNDSDPREPLALASMLAGMAFSSCGVGVAHALAMALGSVLHIPHGRAVAMATPIGLRFNAASCRDTYCRLAESCRISGGTPQETANRFVAAIAALLQGVGLAARPQLPGSAASDLPDRLVQSAVAGTRIPLTLNPVRVDQSALRRLFEELLGGH